MIKKISALVLAGAMALSLAACGAEDKVTPPGGSNPGTSASGTSSSSGSGELTGLTEAFAEAPILLTTGGQSADYQMVGTLMKNLGMDYTMNNVATSLMASIMSTGMLLLAQTPAIRPSSSPDFTTMA